MDKRYFLGCLDPFGHVCVRAEFDMFKLARVASLHLSRRYDKLTWVIVNTDGEVLLRHIAGAEKPEGAVKMDSPDDIAEFDIPEWQEGYFYTDTRYTLLDV